MITIRKMYCRLLVASLTGTIAFAGCNAGKSNTTSKPSTGSNSAPAPAPRVETGPELYNRLEMPKFVTRSSSAEPIVVPEGVIQFDRKIQLSFDGGNGNESGKIELVATPLQEGVDPKSVPNSLLQYHPRDKTMPFRRLQITNNVTLGQTVCRIDESSVLIALESTNKMIEAAENIVKSSERVVVTSQSVVDQYKKSGSTSVSTVEAANAEANLAMAQKSKEEAVRDLTRLIGERLTLRYKLDQYLIKSPVNGRVLKILKNPGESVKSGEPILEIQETARFKVEAKIDIQEANRLRPGMPVIVEPARPLSPEPYAARHRQDVTGIAVTGHRDRPLIVSSSTDATAIVWDMTSNEKKQYTLPHPSGVGVKSVAVTPGTNNTHLAATGGSDGKIRIWDLNNPENIPTTPRDEFEEAHSLPITSLSFSPDGNYLASVAGREVFLWDVASKKKKYALPSDHRDDVTSIRFTPQCTLMTVCRDKTIRFYTLGAQAAALDKTIEHRAGNIDQLGLSSDGGLTLFDQEAGRVDVVSLADNRTVGSLFNSGLRFAGLAIFSPDDTYAITSAGETEAKGELQLWEIKRKREDGTFEIRSRASERRRLVTPGRSAVTAAGFSPDGKYIVVGTQSGSVHFWNRSSAVGENNEFYGTIVTITETDSRTSQIAVEVENKESADLLADKGSATIIVDPEAKPRTPAQDPKKLPIPGKTTVNTPPVQPGNVIQTGAIGPKIPEPGPLEIRQANGEFKPAREGDATYVVPAMRIPPSTELNPLLKPITGNKPK